MTNIHLYRYVSLVIFRLEIRGENFSFFFSFFSEDLRCGDEAATCGKSSSSGE